MSLTDKFKFEYMSMSSYPGVTVKFYRKAFGVWHQIYTTESGMTKAQALENMIINNIKLRETETNDLNTSRIKGVPSDED